MDNEKELTTTVQATETSPPPSITLHHPSVRQERPMWLKIILLIIDISLALSPLLFLGIAFSAIAYNHKPVNDDPILLKNVTVAIKGYSVSRQLFFTAGGRAVMDVAQIAVSIFPILFAAVVGRFMKSYALRRAERGSTIGVLEQLYGSQNLSNAVQLLFALRGPGLLGVAVVIVWLLSPLGGQGVKRVLGTRQAQFSRDNTVYYCNTSSVYSRFAIDDNYMSAKATMRDALISLLFTDSSSRNSDVWGNVKMPRLTQIEANNSDWVDTRQDITFSAIAGLLFNNLPNDTIASFDIITSYMNLDCQDPKIFDYVPAEYNDDDTPSDMTGYQNFVDWAGPLLYHKNLTMTNNLAETRDNLTYKDWNSIIDVRLHPNSTGDTDMWIQPPPFVFANQDFAGISVGDNSGTRIHAYECASSMQWLEVSLECDVETSPSSPCSVVRARATSQPASLHEHPLFTTTPPSEFEHPRLYWFLDLVNQFDSLTEKNYFPSDFNRYLAGGGTFFTENPQATNWSTVTGADLSLDLSTILNTAWLIGVQFTSLAQPEVMNITVLQESDPTSPTYVMNQTLYGSGTDNFLDFIGYDVTAATNQMATYEIYQVNWTWITIAIVITLLLLIFGLLGLNFRHTNHHPDILGFVSTLTRDNPHFDPPPQAEKLDGMEMASYYKHTKVQLVNTAESDEPTRITLRHFQRSSGSV